MTSYIPNLMRVTSLPSLTSVFADISTILLRLNDVADGGIVLSIGKLWMCLWVCSLPFSSINFQLILPVLESSLIFQIQSSDWESLLSCIFCILAFFLERFGCFRLWYRWHCKNHFAEYNYNMWDIKRRGRGGIHKTQIFQFEFLATSWC